MLMPTARLVIPNITKSNSIRKTHFKVSINLFVGWGVVASGGRSGVVGLAAPICRPYGGVEEEE